MPFVGVPAHQEGFVVVWGDEASVVASLESICGLPNFAAEVTKWQHHVQAEVEEMQKKTVEH